MKKNTNSHKLIKTYLLITFTLGLIVGYSIQFISNSPAASPNEIEKAKNKITELLKDKTVDYCYTSLNKDGSINEMSEKFVVNYRYLRINRFANRAIITDCAGYSTLLVKNKSGDWGYTTINQITDNRVNPKWQKECLIEDITVADEVVRPENKSIDSSNFEQCKNLRNL